MTLPKRLPWDFSVDGAGGDAGGGAGGGGQGSGGTGGDAGGSGGQGGGAAGPLTAKDLSAKFSEGYNDGKSKAERDFIADLQKNFNVTSIADLKKHVESLQSEGRPDQKQQIETLTSKINELTSGFASERLGWKIEAAMAGLSAHSPSMTAAEVLKRYDVDVDSAGRETIYEKGTKKIVVLDGKAAGLRDLMQYLAKEDKDFSWHFGKAGGGGNASGTGGAASTTFTTEMLKSQAFVDALNATGQYMAFINGKPINEEAVKALLKK